jgi:hypothetical protein
MFPNISYDAKGDGRLNQYKNIFRRVKLTAQTQIVDFDYYDVQDGESPEIIAHKYYKDVGLHWTILVANNIVDYYHDWPMSMQTFEQYITEKYDNPAGIHHYEISQTSGDTTEIINVGMNTTDYSSATPVSNYQYEQKLQEEKSKIRLIQPRYIEDFVKEFETKIKEGA